MNDFEKQNIEMKTLLKRFCKICDKTAPWESSIDTLAGAANVMANVSEDPTESAALDEMSVRFKEFDDLRRGVAEIMGE